MNMTLEGKCITLGVQLEVDMLKIHEIMCLTNKLNRSKPEKKGDNKVGSRTLKQKTHL